MKKVVMSFNGSEKILLIGYQEDSYRLFNMTDTTIAVKWFGQDLDLPPSGIVVRIQKKPSGEKVVKRSPEQVTGVFFIVNEDIYLISHREDFIAFKGKQPLIVSS